jgi:hypothetical protein
MLKKIMLIMLLYGNCLAMSQNEQFLDFVNKSKVNLETLRNQLQGKASDEHCTFNNAVTAFLNRYGSCFEGTVVTEISTGYSASVFYTAAQLIGIAYLEEGMRKSQITSLEKALAWFKSIPVSFQQVDISPIASDSCVVDYKRTIESELQRITEQNEKLQQLKLQTNGVF